MADTVKHTPGSWAVEDPMGADVGLSIVQAGLKSYEWTFIAMVLKSEPEDSEEVGRVISSKEQMANARLIAAAPDLLKVLKRIDAAMDFNGTCHPLFKGLQQQMQDAIAKAEGRS